MGSFLLILISLFQLQAKDLSPVEVYAKCYARLSDFPVSTTSQDYQDVAAGRLGPVAACMKLIDRAKLVTKGNRQVVEDSSDAVAVSVLRNFDQFHQSWFSALGDARGALASAYWNFVDVTEPALFITNALFGSKHYKTVITSNEALRGVRTGANTTTIEYYINNIFFKNRLIFSGPLAGAASGVNANYDLSNVFEVNFTKVPIGQLIGVSKPPVMTIPLPVSLYTTLELTPARLAGSLDSVSEHNLDEHHGGGVLGSPSYILSNAESVGLLDGGVRVHRRMANNFFYDLMCSSLPNLRTEDVDAYMEKYKASDLSFRRDRSCARCHATLDPFADTFRNLVVRQTSNTAYRDSFRDFHTADPRLRGAVEMNVIKKYIVRTNAQVVQDQDTMYFRRQPRGQLFYRNYNGQLINQTVNGPADMGEKIAAQDDIYICAAQRYYQFLTGVHIPVVENGDGEFYKKHRALIVQLGQNLKTHGSLKTLISDILKTDAFQTRFVGYELQSEANQ